MNKFNLCFVHFILISILSVLLSSCTGVSKKDLVAPEQVQSITIEESLNVIFTSETEWVNQLLKGTYTSIGVGRNGEYFLGAGNSIRMVSPEGKISFLHGGIITPPTNNGRPEIFIVIGSLNHDSNEEDNTEEDLAYEVSSKVMENNDSSKTQGIVDGAFAGAVGGSIVRAAIRAEKGRFKIMKDVDIKTFGNIRNLAGYGH